MYKNKAGSWTSVLVLACLQAQFANAELVPVDDADLAQITGQAYISIDKTYHPEASAPNSDKNFSYTRINLGMDIKTLTNIDRVELGRYKREGDDREGMADFLANNMALGYIYDQAYFERNPSAAQPIKGYNANGTPIKYRDGEIVPFEIKNPYLEFAYDENTDRIVGVRMGLGEAMGVLSGAVQTFTGNLEVDIVDTGSSLTSDFVDKNYCGGGLTCGTTFYRLLANLSSLLVASSPITAKAVLINANGQRDSIRAEYIGVPNGEPFNINNVNAITKPVLQLMDTLNIIGNDIEWTGNNAHIINKDCHILGISSCFDLEQYQSFTIGTITQKDGGRYLTNPTGGTFLSFSTIGDDSTEAGRLEWLNDINKENPTVDDFMKVTSGFYLNIPEGNVQVNLGEAILGTNRVRTEYINLPGRNLF